MPTASDPRTRIRRRDRAVDDEGWIAAYLEAAPWGFLATVEDGQPFLNANLFVYDPERHAIYLHTAKRGRTRDNVEREERACFSVGELGRLLPAPAAPAFSAEYAAVVVFGRAALVGDPAEAGRAMALLMTKYAPHLEPDRDYAAATAGDVAAISVLRIAIEAWSGKRKEVAADFPGAYRYPRPRVGLPAAEAGGPAKQASAATARR